MGLVYKIEEFRCVYGSEVMLKLANGVSIHLCSNTGGLHLSFGGINSNIPIVVSEQSDMSLRVEYKAARDSS